MKKNFLVFLFTTFFTTVSYARVRPPTIKDYPDGSEVIIGGQEELDEFFAKIKRGKQDFASNNDKEYYEDSKKIEAISCNGADAFENDKIKQLPAEIGEFKLLRVLSLENNELASLPPEIGNLKSLVKLELSNNRLRLLPPEIENLKCLWALYLENNLLTSLPVELMKLKRLRILDLSYNQLVSFPVEIRKLMGVWNFKLGHNPIQYLPRKLHGWGESFLFFDGFYDRCVNRKPPVEPPVPMPYNGELKFNHPVCKQWFWDKYRRDPGFKKQMKSEVKTVVYTGLLKKSLAPPQVIKYRGLVDGVGHGEMFFLEFTSTEQLDVFRDRFEFDEAFREKALKTQTLRLQGLGVNRIPEFIFELENLERLFLEDNRIEEVPEEIGQLKKITHIALGNNCVRKLPGSLKSLSKLVGLSIDRNPLDAKSPIPCLGHLEYLKFISMDSGVVRRLKFEGFSDIDSEIIKSGVLDMSVIVKPSRSRPACGCVIS